MYIVIIIIKVKIYYNYNLHSILFIYLVFFLFTGEQNCRSYQLNVNILKIKEFSPKSFIEERNLLDEMVKQGIICSAVDRLKKYFNCNLCNIIFILFS